MEKKLGGRHPVLFYPGAVGLELAPQAGVQPHIAEGVPWQLRTTAPSRAGLATSRPEATPPLNISGSAIFTASSSSPAPGSAQHAGLVPLRMGSTRP